MPARSPQTAMAPATRTTGTRRRIPLVMRRLRADGHRPALGCGVHVREPETPAPAPRLEAVAIGHHTRSAPERPGGAPPRPPLRDGARTGAWVRVDPTSAGSAFLVARRQSAHHWGPKWLICVP